MDSQVNDDFWSCLVAMLEGVTIQDWKVIKKMENYEDDVIKFISPDRLVSRTSEEIKDLIIKEKKKFLKDPKYDNAPVPGPHLYFVLAGFQDVNLIFELLNLGVPLVTMIIIGDYKTKKTKFWTNYELIKNDIKLKNFIVTQLVEVNIENLKNLLFNIVKDMRNYIHYMSHIKYIKIPKANINNNLFLKYKKQFKKIPLENTTVEIVLHCILETIQSNLKINKKEKPFLINHKDKISINSFISDYFLDLKDIHTNMYMNMPYVQVWHQYNKEENIKLKSHLYKLWRCTDFTFDVFKVLLHKMFLLKMFRVGDKNYEYEDVPVLTKFFECPEILSLFDFESDYKTDSVRYEEFDRFLFLQCLQESFSHYKNALFHYLRLTDKMILYFHNDYGPKVTEKKVKMKTKMGFSDFYNFGKNEEKIWIENESENIRKIDLMAKRKAIKRAKMFGFSSEKVQFPLPKIEKYEALEVYDIENFIFNEKTIEFGSIDGPVLTIKMENEKSSILYDSINENIIINDIIEPDMTIIGQNIAFYIKINFDGGNLAYDVRTCLENGLHVNLENVEGKLCVRQEYVREDYLMAEKARVGVENGEIIIFKMKDALILKPDGTICTINGVFEEGKREFDEEISEASIHLTEDKFQIPSHAILDPYGFVTMYKKGEKIEEKHFSRIRVAYLLGRQLYIKREDGTNSFYKEDGKLHVKYIDGTLITTKPTQRKDDDFVIFDNEYIQEHPRYSRVHFKKDSCTVTFQESTFLRKNDFYTINFENTIISFQKDFISIKTKHEKTTESYFYPQNATGDRKAIFICKDSSKNKFSYYNDKTYSMDQKSETKEISGRLFVANRDMSGVEFLLKNNEIEDSESLKDDLNNKNENEKVRIEIKDKKMFQTKSEIVPYKYEHKMEILSRGDLSPYLPQNYKWYFKPPRKINLCRPGSSSYVEYEPFKTRRPPVAILFQKTTVVFADVFSTYKNGFLKYFNYHKNLLENYKIYLDLPVPKVKVCKEMEEVKTNELRRMRKARQNNVIQTI